MKKTTEYISWLRIKARCYYEKCDSFARYGGRGITVCERWRHSYNHFLADMGKKPSPKHQIDRVDNDGNYAPENCKWSTPKENAQNRCTKRILKINGVCKSLSQWSEESGVHKATLMYRADRNWPDCSILLKARTV